MSSKVVRPAAGDFAVTAQYDAVAVHEVNGDTARCRPAMEADRYIDIPVANLCRMDREVANRVMAALNRKIHAIRDCTLYME